jgi:hypothetical protein
MLRNRRFFKWLGECFGELDEDQLERHAVFLVSSDLLSGNLYTYDASTGTIIEYGRSPTVCLGLMLAPFNGWQGHHRFNKDEVNEYGSLLMRYIILSRLLLPKGIKEFSRGSILHYCPFLSRGLTYTSCHFVRFCRILRFEFTNWSLWLNALFKRFLPGSE